MSSSDMEQGLDQEGKDVLAELEKEGFSIAGRDDAEPEPEKPEEKPEKVEEKVEKKEDVKPEVKESEPDKKTGEDPDPDKKPQEPRKPQFVPISKYLEAERLQKEAEARVAELTKAGQNGTQTQNQIEAAGDAVKKIVDMGYDEDEAKKIAAIIAAVVPGQTLPPEVAQKLAKLDEVLKRTEIEVEKNAFESDFNEQVLKQFPHLAKYKEDIKNKAYTDEFKAIPLRTLAIEYMHDNGISAKAEPVRTAERSTGGTQSQASTGDEIDYNTLTEEQFAALTPAQQDKFFEFQEQKERKARGALDR